MSQEERAERRYCANCGTAIRVGHAFCVSCGKRAPTSTERPRNPAAAGSLRDGFATTSQYQPSEAGFGHAIREAYREASSWYRSWIGARAAERERVETLRVIESGREARRSRFTRYVRFFERALDGSRTALDWWLAYQDDEREGERGPSVADLLSSARDKAEAGLESLRKSERPLADLLSEDLFGEADRLLDGVSAGQEDLGGGESVFGPLVAAHEKIRRLKGWSNYRAQLEVLVKDLEDILGSSAVRTTAANRIRFPDPHGASSGTASWGPSAPPTAPPPAPHAPVSQGSGGMSGLEKGIIAWDLLEQSRRRQEDMWRRKGWS